MKGEIKAVSQFKKVLLIVPEETGQQRWFKTTDNVLKYAKKGKCEFQIDETNLITLVKMLEIQEKEYKPFQRADKLDLAPEKAVTMRESYCKDILVAIINNAAERKVDLDVYSATEVAIESFRRIMKGLKEEDDGKAV